MANKGAKGLEITGFKEIYKNMGLLEEEILKGAVKGLKITAQNIAGEARRIVPRDTGTLSNSIVVTRGSAPTNSDEIYRIAQNNAMVEQRIKDGIENPGVIEKMVVQSTNKQDLKVSISANTPYALKQHEDATLNHPNGGEAKYLERPFNEKAGELEVNIGNEINRILRKKNA